MLRKQHKVDDSHYDMPLIYYTEGHSLYFGRPEFALITGLPFGTVNFGLYTFGELMFRNRVFQHKLRLSVTNLDVIGVIENEETFRKLCDQDSIRLCLILALEVIFMGRLLICPMDDTLFRLVENLEDWNCFPWGEHIWTHLYDEIKNVIEKHTGEHYFGMKNDRMFGSLSHLKDVIVGELKIQKLYQEHLDEVICELNVRVFKLKTIIQVLARERNEGYEVFVVEDELILRLEDEERMLLEQEKNIIE
nr:phospholipase-like protein [Tanacetum cinerariifolium]